jgi:ABC transporter DrrB family efflux protein
MSAFAEAAADAAVITKRNLIKIKRVPDLLVFTTLSPIMFVLLFAYVFGGAIDVPGTGYREFLIAGIFAQTVVFGSTFTGFSLAEDLQKGVIDRFRSLPMAPSAVLFGRTLSDVVNNVISLAVMALTGLVVGWRIRSSVLEALAGFAVVLLFAYAISWVMAVVGLIVRSPEVVNNASFIVIFPLTFIANTFVPSQSLPSALRVFASMTVARLSRPPRQASPKPVPAPNTTAGAVATGLRPPIGKRCSGDSSGNDQAKAAKSFMRSTRSKPNSRASSLESTTQPLLVMVTAPFWIGPATPSRARVTAPSDCRRLPNTRKASIMLANSATGRVSIGPIWQLRR